MSTSSQVPFGKPFQTKNSQGRVVVLNTIAKRVVDEPRSKHSEFVFTYKGHYLFKMLNSAWRRARDLRSCLAFECMIFAILLGTGCELQA
jgi:hypothetical protein